MSRLVGNDEERLSSYAAYFPSFLLLASRDTFKVELGASSWKKYLQSYFVSASLSKNDELQAFSLTVYGRMKSKPLLFQTMLIRVLFGLRNVPFMFLDVMNAVSCCLFCFMCRITGKPLQILKMITRAD